MGRTTRRVKERTTWAVWLAIGAAFGLLGVAVGAAGTHALEGRIDADAMDTLRTAVRFQMQHAIALVALGGAAKVWRSRATTVCGALFAFGVVVFCGSLYALALFDAKPFGAVAPVGGLALMAGWGALAVGAVVDLLRRRK